MPAPLYNSIDCPVVTWRPNWDTAPRLRQEYSTLVFEKLDLSEERLQGRPRCLYGITFDVTTFGPRETGSARRFFETLPTTPVGVPFWVDAVPASAALEAGAATLPITGGEGRMFDVFPGYVLVWEAWDKFEVIAFASATDTEVALVGTLVGNYAAGALVAPLAFGQVKRPEFSQITGSHATFAVDFLEIFHDLELTSQTAPEQDMFPLEYDFSFEGELPCREIIHFDWDLDPNFVTRQDVIQASLTEDGDDLTWYDYIVAVPTEDQLEAGHIDVYLNNTFAGARWFRLQRDGVTIASAVAPAGAAVNPPSGITIGNTYTSPNGLFASGPFIRPISYIENETLNPTVVYIEPALRLEYYRGINWDGITTPVTFDEPDPAEILRWTNDGSDPAEDMAWPRPYEEGINNNARCYSPGFSLAIRARCFNVATGCRSPMTLVLVDKLHDIYNYISLQGASVSGTGACDLTMYDASGHPVESGCSCLDFWGGPGQYRSYVLSFLCGKLAGPATREEGGKHVIFSVGTIIEDKNAYTGGTWWPAHTVGAYRFYAQAVVGDYRPGGYWDSVPIAFEFVKASVGEEDYKSALPVATPTGGVHLAGPGGSLQGHCSFAGGWILGGHPEGAPACAGVINGEVCLDSFESQISLYNDVALEVDAPAPPAPGNGLPEPPASDAGYQDTFESYLDGDATAMSLDGGDGWDSAWVFANASAAYGTDTFEDYIALEDGELDFRATDFVPMTYGEGWAEAWGFADTTLLLGWDNFEDYEDGLQDETEAVRMNLGFGWTLIYPGDPDLAYWGMADWLWRNISYGSEGWESYADMLVDEETVLNNTDRMSWINNDRWYFHEIGD